jgi:hypothetical protein
MTGFPSPLSKLAPRTPQQKCVHRMRRSSKTTFSAIGNSPTAYQHLICSPVAIVNTEKNSTQNRSAKDQIAFNIHNPN